MFRKEALENQKWRSTAILFSRIPSWFIFSISFIIMTSFIFYIVFGSYTRRETIFGEVVMQPHPIILSAYRSGYISDIYVEVNHKVHKGDPLFKITLDRITDSGNVGINSILSIRKQISRLNEIMQSVKNSQKETISSLEKQISNNRRIYNETKMYLDEVRRTTENYFSMLEKYEKLMKKGYSSNDEVTLQRTRYFEQKTLQNNLEEKLIQQESILINLENEIETKKTEFKDRIIRYELQQNELEIRLLDFESVSELIINAPIDGIIESTSVTIGQIIKENDSLAQIVPANKNKYQLVMWIPNNAISYVNINDEISIRYEAFPFEKFGQFRGVIKYLSSIPASLQELSFYKNIPSSDPNNPLYKIVVDIPDQYVIYNNYRLHFLSGMKAEATIFMENRKLYEWILYPYYNLKKNMEVKNE